MFDFFLKDVYNHSQSAGIAQVVERGPEKPGVPSATLGPGTIMAKVPMDHPPRFDSARFAQ